MRRAAKLDGNHAMIVRELRQVPGCTVLSLAGVGNGAPDLLVGFMGYNVLLEVKDPAQPQSKRQLTPMEADFHRSWTGQVAVVETLNQALAAVLYADHNVLKNRTRPSEDSRVAVGQHPPAATRDSGLARP